MTTDGLPKAFLPCDTGDGDTGYSSGYEDGYNDCLTDTKAPALRLALEEIIAMVDDGTILAPNGGNHARFAKWCHDATNALRDDAS